MLGTIGIGTVGFGLGTIAWAQTFDVVSIKPRTGPRVRFLPDVAAAPDRYSAPDTTLMNMISFAYEIEAPQIEGGPDWLKTSRFEVNAKAPGAASRSDLRLLVKAMLTDRFQLKTHIETRELPIYALVVARGDRRPAAGLQPASEDACKALADPARRTDDQVPCGVLRATPEEIMAAGIGMAQLARILPVMGVMTGVDRVVVDKTGLTGRFAFRIRYTAANVSPGAAPPTDAPGLFTALQEQLGLRLEPGRGPVDILIIDSAQQPAAD